MESINFDNAQSKTMGKVRIDVVVLKGFKVTRVTISPGGGWSTDLKEFAGTDSCMVNHKGFVMSGVLAMRMDDGTERHFKHGDVVNVPAGHDTWCVGEEPGVWIEFEQTE